MSDYMIDCATKEEWAERALRAEDKLAKAVGDLNATLQREKDANSKAMKHLRNLEKEKIKTVNYGKFNHEWRREVFMLRRKLAKAVECLVLADSLSEECENAFDHVDGSGTQEFYLALYQYTDARAALAELEDKTDE